MDNTENAIILLTYKGKILLMLSENNPYIFNDPCLIRKHSWNFIGAIKRKNESFKETIITRVKNITGIKLQELDLLSSVLTPDGEKHLYHAHLSDHEVNNMVRGEGKLIQFFSFKELGELVLSNSTKMFISRHTDLMKKISHKTAPYSSL